MLFFLYDAALTAERVSDPGVDSAIRASGALNEV